VPSRRRRYRFRTGATAGPFAVRPRRRVSESLGGAVRPTTAPDARAGRAGRATRRGRSDSRSPRAMRKRATSQSGRSVVVPCGCR
jgi:hypothetical protein